MCVVYRRCGILQHVNVVIFLILPLELQEFELVELDLGRSFVIFIDKFFDSLLGETIAVIIASFSSCETAFEDKGGFTLLELLLVMGLPSCELLSGYYLFGSEFSEILAIGHDGKLREDESVLFVFL